MKDDIKDLLNVSLKLTRDFLLVPFLIISTSNLRYKYVRFDLWIALYTRIYQDTL